MHKITKFLVSIFVCLLAGFLGSLFTTPQINGWYASLNKPEFNPPNSIFGPVWTTLFILMGIALFLVWIKFKKNKTAKAAFVFFMVHLVVNIMWSVVFFGAQNPGLAMIVIIALWLMIAMLLVQFYKINKYAGYLLIPYLLWVSFASVLNYNIWQLNM